MRLKISNSFFFLFKIMQQDFVLMPLIAVCLCVFHQTSGEDVEALLYSFNLGSRLLNDSEVFFPNVCTSGDLHSGFWLILSSFQQNNLHPRVQQDGLFSVALCNHAGCRHRRQSARWPATDQKRRPYYSGQLHCFCHSVRWVAAYLPAEPQIWKSEFCMTNVQFFFFPPWGADSSNGDESFRLFNVVWHNVVTLSYLAFTVFLEMSKRQSTFHHALAVGLLPTKYTVPRCQITLTVFSRFVMLQPRALICYLGILENRIK